MMHNKKRIFGALLFLFVGHASPAVVLPPSSNADESLLQRRVRLHGLTEIRTADHLIQLAWRFPFGLNLEIATTAQLKLPSWNAVTLTTSGTPSVKEVLETIRKHNPQMSFRVDGNFVVLRSDSTVTRRSILATKLTKGWTFKGSREKWAHEFGELLPPSDGKRLSIFVFQPLSTEPDFEMIVPAESTVEDALLEYSRTANRYWTIIGSDSAPEILADQKPWMLMLR